MLLKAITRLNINKTAPTVLQKSIKKTREIRLIPETNKHFLQVRHCGGGSPTQSDTNPDPALRFVRQEFSDPCQFCLIPETWLNFFHTKTGVTGFYTFVATFGTYLISKEIYVMEHEYYTGLSMIILCFVGIKYIGPGLTDYLDKEIDKLEKAWNLNRKSKVAGLKQNIDQEEELQWSKEGELFLLDVKRQNVLMQLEYTYRKRLMKVYHQIKRRFDYQLAIYGIENRFKQRNLIEWITAQIMKELTPEHDIKTFEACLTHIKVMANELERKEAIEAASNDPKNK